MREDRARTTSVDDWQGSSETATDDVSAFAESYASFNRIINGLQRQYIGLKEEFSQQNDQLADTNLKLMDMTRKHVGATEFLGGVLNSIAAGIIAVDASGVITHFNPAASMLFGLAIKETVGKPYRDVIEPGLPLKANALRAMESGRATEGVERQIELADGTRLCVNVSTAIIHDDNQTPIGAVEVLHDLTKLKRMELEITRLNTLAALGEMAATIAHEVRNPLAGVGGFAGLLRRDIDKDDPRRKLVDKISKGVESLNQTITSLLSYTRVEEVKREEVAFDEFLRSTLEKYKYEHSEQVARMKFVLHPIFGAGASPLKLLIDPILMRQCFYNLFNNAVNACGKKGTIQIDYGRLPRQKASRQYAQNMILGLDETVVEIAITDSGPGIPPESISKLFTPFYSTSSGGTGLGLAMVWKILKAHGGEVLAANSPEGGARFTVLLPVKINAASSSESNSC